jgi:cellulose synthase/poly-beta-1,6-N-acetylglucosamine synthase-like glycosyltransferase
MFLCSLSIFLGTYSAYFFYIRKNVGRAWGIKVDEGFEPEISILIPVHNEEANIESKLENIKSVSYPREKMEIVVVDDASNDGTVEKVENFMRRYPKLNIKLVRQNPRAGKSAALNKALHVSTNPIVLVSDADTKWPRDILRKALPYLANPEIGAITGRGVNANVEASWVTKAEKSYLQVANFVRLGESKIHSTIRFEGGFCAYKRNAFDIFDCETGSDDSGTALKVVSRGYRSIMVPEAIFYTSFPPSFIAKFKIKLRRANQLISLWVKCLKLLLKRRLSLPKRIVIPEIALFIFNPIILLILIASSVALIILNPLSPLSLAIIFSVLGLLVFVRHVFVELIVDNIILLSALTTYMFRRRYVVWEK